MIDVCLLLEGTYPYVAGGVSTWVHQLVSAMKDIRFGIIYIAPHSDPTRTPKYEIPNHILYLKEIYLHDYDLEPHKLSPAKPRDFDTLHDFYSDLLLENYTKFNDFVHLFQGRDKKFDTLKLFTDRRVWEMLTTFYDKIQDDISFLDFFWTWRGTHLPLLQILTTEIPKAKIYHSVSTGYAGLLGSIIRCLNYGKFFLTEHGIYTHERALEISQANWIYEREKVHYRADRDLSFFKRWWITMFKVMSHLSYQYSDNIITLYEGNKVKEILEGADENKISIIPNGIDIQKFSEIKRERKKTPNIGLIGRVVNIKDIKTFIQAGKLVMRDFEDAHFHIIGPTDEEEDYFEECQNLVTALDMEKNITFTGRQDIKDYLSFLDLLVLTSVSEAQPYVILEGNICGVPIVASDVGACSEMLNGRTHPDKNLGPSGLITQVSNPEDTAQAICKLLSDDEFYNQCAESGIKRVKEYYDQDDLLSRYLNLYEQNL